MICRRGIIYLVGAGPGDPDLITVRGMRLIQQADTIIHDRLIPAEVLEWARPEAKLIDVGKYPCLLYTSPSPRDGLLSRMPSSA